MEALSEASSYCAAHSIRSEQLELTSTPSGEKLPEADSSGCNHIEDSASDTISVSTESHIDALEHMVHDERRRSKLKSLRNSFWDAYRNKKTRKLMLAKRKTNRQQKRDLHQSQSHGGEFPSASCVVQT